MKENGILDIAVGAGAQTKVWKNKRVSWDTFVDKIKEGHRTSETTKEYDTFNKMDRGKVKDVGGYVGGYLRNGKRSPANVIYRSLITLDIDFGHAAVWDDFVMMYGCAAVMHSTHSHRPEMPKYRLIIPVNREVSPDEYQAISRRVAGDVGIDLFDSTTFEPNRLMFWGSCSKDGEYVVERQDGDWLDVDKILSTYSDWRDSALWPISSRHKSEVQSNTKRQEDPREKKGLIGLFCRAYAIQEAIETFLGEDYESAGEDRYTYAKGSTIGGLVIYDDAFAYSHHGTSPTSGKLCNAFDLVRAHKFGNLDGVGSERASFSKMEELVKNDPRVKKLIAKENFQNAKSDFANVDESEEESKEVDLTWMEALEIDSRGNYTSSATNISIIFSNDVRVAGVLKRNEFDHRDYITSDVPWRKVPRVEPMRNVDYAGIRVYAEMVYNIVGKQKIEDALAMELERNTFNPVKDYLSEVVWDGTERINDLLIDYFGAKKSVYTQEAIRKTMVAAVTRVFRPGAKFDMVLTLVGKEGTKKSTFFKKLGKRWFSDTFYTMHGKEAYEQIQGAWIIEMAELAGLKKSEVESTKHFITKQEDTFRPAYGRTMETYRRQCVFVGTTNETDFLTSTTGNRRFNPVSIVAEDIKKDVFTDLTEDVVDQLWAEAVTYYKAGETLYLSAEAERLAKDAQDSHSEVDERAGTIESFLDLPLPKRWDDMDVLSRREYIHSPDFGEKGTMQRDSVCVAEVWCECFGQKKEDMNRYKTREINSMLKNMRGWEAVSSPKSFPIYGRQRYFRRKD